MIKIGVGDAYALALQLYNSYTYTVRFSIYVLSSCNPRKQGQMGYVFIRTFFYCFHMLKPSLNYFSLILGHPV